MQTKVHPLSHPSLRQTKSNSLRGEACLGTDMAGVDGGVEWAGRLSSISNDGLQSEFHLLLEFLDTDANGKVSALELADFVDSLLGTQDHQRPEGSVIFEAVLTCAMRHAVADDDLAASPSMDGPKPGRPPPPPPPPLGTPSELTEKTKPAENPRWSSRRGTAGMDPSTVATASGGMARLGQPQGQGKPLPADSALPGGGGRSSGFMQTEAQLYGSQCFLSMNAVQRCFESLLADTSLWLGLVGRYSIMTTSLFRQLLLYAGGRLERKLSIAVFLRTWGAFNTLPLWLPFTGYWTRHHILLAVYLHQRTKLQQQLGPRLSAVLPMHATLLVLTALQFLGTYVPLIAYFAVHGIPAMWRSHSTVEYFHANPMAKQISFFSSVLPFAALQFLTSSGALKLSCRDFVTLKDQCKAVFLLGDVSTQFEGYPGLTLRALMDIIKGRVEESLESSAFRRMNGILPLLFSIGLEVFRRLVRVFLVHNWVAREPLGKVVTPFEVWGLFYNIWFAYSESADCTAYLFQLKKTCAVFKALLSKEEALSQALPWLNNHSPRNLLLWSRLRRYYQSPNCLELRWIEMHLTLVVLAAIAFTVIIIATFVQKTLLRFTPENADLQVFVAWVIPPFIYLIIGLVVDVILSASTGTQYHDGIMVLSAEEVAISDRLNCAEELAVLESLEPPTATTAATVAATAAADDYNAPATSSCAAAAPATAITTTAAAVSGANLPNDSSALVLQSASASSSRGMPSPSPASASGLAHRRGMGSEAAGAAAGGAAAGTGGAGTGTAALLAPSGRRQTFMLNGRSGTGIGGGGLRPWQPAERFRLNAVERAKLRECQQIIRSLVSYIQFNAEYVTLFGVPVDTQLRNTIFSVAVTLAGAAVSAFLALVLQR